MNSAMIPHQSDCGGSFSLIFVCMSTFLPSFVGISPFGAYCQTCDIPLSLEKGIAEHGKKFHPDIPFKNAIAVREIKQQIKHLRELHSRNLSAFLVPGATSQHAWFCTVCFSSFTKASNFKRHLEVRNNSCSDTYSARQQCYPTICGRLGPKGMSPKLEKRAVKKYISEYLI